AHTASTRTTRRACACATRCTCATRRTCTCATRRTCTCATRRTCTCATRRTCTCATRRTRATRPTCATRSTYATRCARTARCAGAFRARSSPSGPATAERALPCTRPVRRRPRLARGADRRTACCRQRGPQLRRSVGSGQGLRHAVATLQLRQLLGVEDAPLPWAQIGEP